MVDNGSEEPIEYSSLVKDFNLYEVLRFDKNIGMVESFLEGLEGCDIGHDEIIVYTHNDLFIYQVGWDDKIRRAFDENPSLGLVGIVGGTGVFPNGGRHQCHSHLVGDDHSGCTTPDCPLCNNVPLDFWKHHGQLTPPDGIPAAVLDGVLMAFRTSIFEDGFMVDESYPLHHWYDREWACMALDWGFDVKVVDIMASHGSGTTANTSEIYHKSAQEWAKENRGITELPEGIDNWDHFMYKEAEKLWMAKWAHRLPIVVDKDYNIYGDNWNVQ